MRTVIQFTVWDWGENRMRRRLGSCWRLGTADYHWFLKILAGPTIDGRALAQRHRHFQRDRLQRQALKTFGQAAWRRVVVS